MHPVELKRKLVEWTLANARMEKRTYLGMSGIGQCPRKLYFDLVNGREEGFQMANYSYLGYLFEDDMKRRLAGIDESLLGPSEEFIDEGGQFQGHSDGSWDGDLLEIKSTTAEKVDNVAAMGLPHQHRYQVQAYLHYSGRRYAQVIYVARDTGDIHVAGVKYQPELATEIREKAMRILEAVERRQPPACECHYCRR